MGRMNNDRVDLRPLTPNDAQTFRAIRLKALKNHPEFFTSYYDKTEPQPDEYWKETLDGKGKQVFGLFAGEKLVGIAGIFKESHAGENSAGLHMVYIEPDFRGRKLTRPLYEACIEWARKNNFRHVYVSHREGNEQSKHAVMRFRFDPISIQDKIWPDGKLAKDHVYRLEL